MSKSTLIVMVLALILSLTGCGSSSLLEPTKPPLEAIKLANEDININESSSKIINHFGDDVEEEYKGVKITYKKVPISDADKFNGISEEWSLVHEYQSRYRIKSNLSVPLVSVPVVVELDDWSKWSEWYSESKKSKLSKEKGEWKINKELTNTFKTYPRPK